MKNIWQHRPLRFVFLANLVSMIGSGMNSAAVIWTILQRTHNEESLGLLQAVQTIPAILLLPFTGVLIDREDRRRIVMLLDAGRAVVIAVVAYLAFTGQVQLWHLYAMYIMVAMGFWMFWPTVTALIQELTPDAEFVGSNALLQAGVQGGWVLAGALVGFAYNHIGLAGVLVIDVCTYVISFLCYLGVRRGRHVVAPQAVPSEGDAWTRYWHEVREGLRLVRDDRHILLIGLSSSLFVAGMLTQGVVTAPLSDRILKAGAVGYGWINGGWAIGAVLSVTYVAVLIRKLNPRWAAAISLSVLAFCNMSLPFSGALSVAVLIYFVMGSARGLGGISLQSEMMELVPKRFMGRVQNTFYFIGTGLQVIACLLVGSVAHRGGLVYGFAIIGLLYIVASITAAGAAMHGRQALAAAAPRQNED